MLIYKVFISIHFRSVFNHKNYLDLNIVNTKNALDGGVFTQLKKLTKLHQGISKSLKSKLIDD